MKNIASIINKGMLQKNKSLCFIIAFQLLWLLAVNVRSGHTISFLILFVVTDIPLTAYQLSDDIHIKAFALAALTSLSLNVKMSFLTEEVSDYELGIFIENRLSMPLMLCAFFSLYLYLIGSTEEIRASKTGRVAITILAFLFSIFLLFGYSFQEIDSWEMVFANSFQMCKAYLFLIGIFYVCYYCIAWLYSFADNGGIDQVRLCGPFEWYINIVRIRPFIVTFLTLLVFSLPYMITAYPGIFAGDTLDQILQAFQIPYQSNVGINLMSKNQMINQHHSVMHTMLMHVFLCLGIEVFHSANIGIFITAFLQTVITFAGIAFLVKTLIADGASDIHVLILILYFIISPRIQCMLFVLSKDVLYGAVTLFSLVFLWKLITGRQCSKMTPIYYYFSLIMMQMLRKEGLYIIIIQMIVIMIASRKKWKTWMGGLVSVLLISVLFGRIVYPVFNISPGTMKEALSIPIQQTARYIQCYPNEITSEERRAIDRMWDFEELSFNYDPGKSDSAKATFRIDSTREDWLAYFSAWFAMLKKHPMVYIQATMNNYYEYVYPGRANAEAHTFERRKWDIDFANEKLADKGVFIHYPNNLDRVRMFLETSREKLFRLPVLSLFLSVACYTWVLFVSFSYWIYRRNKDAALIFLPLILILMVCFSGPCNGAYFRYYYPIVLCLPAAILLAWSLRECKK